jgi:hemerythrin-like metal-binding protein
MPNHVQWDPLYSVGNEVLDNQHKAILAQCNALGDCTANSGHDAEQRFRANFNELLTSAREHFLTEEALLRSTGCPELDEHKEVQEEFEYLAADIITTDNFEMTEIQRFLALWWVGHLIDTRRLVFDRNVIPVDQGQRREC